jgi:hypothetical protein
MTDPKNKGWTRGPAGTIPFRPVVRRWRNKKSSTCTTMVVQGSFRSLVKLPVASRSDHEIVEKRP